MVQLPKLSLILMVKIKKCNSWGRGRGLNIFLTAHVAVKVTQNLASKVKSDNDGTNLKL